jgi:hypothetical protein
MVFKELGNWRRQGSVFLEEDVANTPCCQKGLSSDQDLQFVPFNIDL